MKKSLVLAMAMALGVTASAYAANPFSDVPAGHWAYDAVNKLAAEGVVDGYPDGTYGGDKLMTRYEMAQIVAKAMAKGANVDKLAAEFADELDSLGVRVANLEKKADNVKITGQIRASYRSMDGDQKVKGSNHDGRLRTRLFVNGAINEDRTYTGRFENSQYYTNDTDHPSDDDVELNWAYVTGKVGGVKVMAGRQDFKLHDGNVIDGTVDGFVASYGKDVKLTGYVGKAVDDGATFDNLNDVEGAMDEGDRVYIADLSAKLGVVDTFVTYYKADTMYDNEIWNVGAGLNVVKDLKLSAEYLHGDADNQDGDNNGYVVGLAYRGAKAAKPGSWGVYAKYYDQPQSTFLEHTIDGYAPFDYKYANDGFEGYEIGANVALAKNIVAAVKYYDLEAREGASWDDQTLWSEVVFTF